MSGPVLNLSRRPFVNTRPVIRLTVLLWVLGGLLLAANLWFYQGYLVGRGEAGKNLREVEEAITAERQLIADLERQVASYDLATMNQTAGYLNLKIAERSLAWSALFDRLAELMPDDVRLRSLNPGTGRERDRQLAAEADDRVQLEIRGQAKSDEALFAMVDALFDDPAFEDPNLLSETRPEGAQIVTFQLNVSYLPGVAEQLVTAASEVVASEVVASEVVASEAVDEEAEGGDDE